jgi:hypothetical protein
MHYVVATMNQVYCHWLILATSPNASADIKPFHCRPLCQQIKSICCSDVTNQYIGIIAEQRSKGVNVSDSRAYFKGGHGSYLLTPLLSSMVRGSPFIARPQDVDG